MFQSALFLFKSIRFLKRERASVEVSVALMIMPFGLSEGQIQEEVDLV